MPGRRVHVACSLLYAKTAGIRAEPAVVEIINTLIDHPGRARGLIARAAQVLCPGDPGACSRLRAVLHGMRIPGVAVHDWRGRLGRRTLARVVEALYPGYEWVVGLHDALDCLEQGGWQCRYAPPELVEWARSSCAGAVGARE